MLGEGVVAEVSPVEVTEKGERKRVVTVALLGGGAREPLVIRLKLVGDLVALGDGLEPYQRVQFLGTYRVFNIEGKTWPVVTACEIQRVIAAKAEAA